MHQISQEEERNSGAIHGVKDTDTGGSRNGQGVNIWVSGPQPVAQTQKDQHNGDRIDGVEHGDGDAEDHVKTQIADEEREKNDDEYPLAVGDSFEQGGKVLGDGVNKTYACGQAGKGEDGGQQNCAGVSEELVDDAS